MTDDGIRSDEAGIAQEQTDGALREDAELFSLFMRHSPIYAYIKDVTPTRSVVLQASGNYDQMIGISGADMVGKSMTDLFPAELAAKMTADDWAVVSKGEMLRLDEELNGRSYTSIKFPIVQGGRTLLAGYTIDVTERKQAEEALQESEAKFRSMFENMAAASCLDEIIYEDGKPVDYRILDINPAYEKIIGVTRKDTVGKRASTLYSGGEVPFLNVYIQVAETGKPVSFEAYFPPIKRDLHVTASCPRKGRFSTVFSDITERKQADQALQESEAKFRQWSRRFRSPSIYRWE